MGDVPAGPLRLEAGRLGLGPGAELAMGGAPGPVLLVVEAGTLGVTAEQGTVAVRQPGTAEQPIAGHDTGLPPPRAAAPTAGSEEQAVGAGGRIVLAAGATAGLAAALVGSVTCLVFALLPEQG